VRIALISPKWHKMVNSYPPLGLAYLAAVLEQAGHEVRIYDFGLTPDTSLEDDVGEICVFSPQLVGITSMTSSYYSAEETVALIKERIGCPVVIGGPHATVMPERVLANPHIDFLVYGEGEETAVELAHALESNLPLGGIHGLYYKENGYIIRNEPRPLIPDLDALPFPARHLLDLTRYPLCTPNGEPMISILSSRGCPYNCSFCFKGIVGRTYRQRSPDNIVAELRSLITTYGIRNFYFIDDLFTINTRRLRTLMQRFLDERLDIHWQCLARVDRVTPDVLKLMHQAGCRQIHYGIESGNEKILAATAKHISLDQVRQAVTWTHEAGIRSKGYFMLGLPGDTEKTMRQTIDFAADLPLDDAMFSITTPFPGTRLWEELVKKNPGTEYGQKFAQAYYYNDYTEEIAPFLNVSQVSDEKLGRMTITARKNFQEGKRRRKYKQFFGERLGTLLWRLSLYKGIRALGRRILDLGVLPGFRKLEGRRTESWS